MSLIEAKGNKSSLLLEYQNQLRQNFLDFFATQLKPNLDESNPVFQFETDTNTQIKLPINTNLLTEIEVLRKQIIHPLRMRGTSTEFMDEAREANLFSAKKVDAWWEDDSGEIATYRIPTSDMRISNKEFLYLFQITSTAALKYALTHNDWYYHLTDYDLKEKYSNLNFDGKLKLAMNHFSKKENNKNGVEVALCFEDPINKREPIIKNRVLPILKTTGKYADVQIYGSYIDQTSYQNIILLDKSVTPFEEFGFSSFESLDQYSPIYTSIGTDSMVNLLHKLRKHNTPERKFLKKLNYYSFTTPIYDSVQYFLGEQVTLRLLNSMHDWSNLNEHFIKYKTNSFIEK